MNIDTKQIGELVNGILELGPGVLLVVSLNVVGWILKQSAFPNRWIPVALMILGGTIYPFIAERQDIVYNVRSPMLLAVIYGLTLGGAAVAIHQTWSGLFNRTQSPNPPSPPTQ